MVRRLLLLTLLGLLLAGRTSHASQYRLWTGTPDGTDLELGRATTIWLNYQGPADLDGLVVTPWERDVAIRRGYARRDGDVQRLRLRVTPRRAGALVLPPLRLGSAVSAPLNVVVQVPRVAGVALAPEWQIGPGDGWQHQERTASLTVTLPAGAELRPVVTPPRGDGLAVVTLPPTQQGTADGRTRYTYHWLLRPRLAGEQSLDPAGLQLMHDGVPRWAFEFPLSRLSARPLPGYITPTVPVGRLVGGVDGGPVQATGPTSPQLHAALQQAGLQADIATVATPTGTRSEIRVRQGWDNAAAGIVYFDTDTGRLRNLHPAQPPMSLGPWLLLALSAMAAATLWLLRHPLVNHLRWRRYWTQLRTYARTQQSPQALRAAICGLPVPDTGVPPRTLAEWHGTVARRRPAVAAVAAHLEAACFGALTWNDDRQKALQAALRNDH